MDFLLPLQSVKFLECQIGKSEGFVFCEIVFRKKCVELCVRVGKEELALVVHELLLVRDYLEPVSVDCGDGVREGHGELHPTGDLILEFPGVDLRRSTFH